MSSEAVEPRSDATPRPAAPHSRRNRALLCVALLLLAASAVASYWRPWSVWRAELQSIELLQRHEDQQARDVLRQALAHNLGHPRTALLLARTHRRLGNLGRSQALLVHAQRWGAKQDEVQLERRLGQIQTGDVRNASRELPALLMQHGHDGPDIFQAFVLGHFANLQTEAAFHLLDLWQEHFPDDPQPLFMRAYLLQNIDRTLSAIEAYRSGLEQAPQRSGMRRRLAEALLAAGKIDEAEQELARCATETPEDPDVAYLQARCEYARGQFADAAALLARLLEHAPQHGEARRLYGQVLLAQDDFAQAASQLQIVVQQRPFDPVAREALGRALRLSGREDEARAHFEFVAQAQQETARLDRLLRDALQQPQNADLRFEIGSILQQYGSPDDAARWMGAVLQVQPDHAGAHRALADYFQRQGNPARAQLHRQQAQYQQEQP